MRKQRDVYRFHAFYVFQFLIFYSAIKYSVIFVREEICIITEPIVLFYGIPSVLFLYFPL